MRTFGRLALCATALIATDALAENPNWPPDVSVTDLSQPQHWPDDPSYGGQWNFHSFVPMALHGQVRPEEIPLGTGLSADRAWQHTTGDDRVLIAIVDSGIRWDSSDLIYRHYLNRGELPQPDVACQTAAYDPNRPWDANGDGAFDVQDYTSNTGDEDPTTPCDPRVLAFSSGNWDTNSNNILDAQDLIRIFSDGTDDDGNGYVDDISGWDFFANDNDPNDDTRFGHGTGEARLSVAEGNNGRGGIGVCPNCRVLNIRVGDSFVADSNNFAMGVGFAVDSGSSVMQIALGGLNDNAFTRTAIDYAYNNGVALIGSAADENAYHANAPSANEHVVYVHAIQHDGLQPETSTTFLNFSNCTNYGPRLELSAPGTKCSSEATGLTSGVAGLLYAAAAKVNIPFPNGSPGATDKFGIRRLSSEEVRQLLNMTVDDIFVAESATDPTKYPSKVGWEQRFGYGRVNAGKAVAAVIEGKIPPEVDLLTPTWYRVIDQTRTPTVELMGHLSFRDDRYQSMDYVIEWAPGVEPGDSDWTEIKSESGVTSAIDGLLASWDISSLNINNPDMPAPDNHANRYLVTIRIRVTANSATLGQVKGETRKAIHIHTDPDLLPAFPINLLGSGESNPKLADLDGDGAREIIVATAEGMVHAFKSDGTELSGWPVTVQPLRALDANHPFHVRNAIAFQTVLNVNQPSHIMATPAIGDVDNDGNLDVVVADMEGRVYVYDRQGMLRSGFPVTVDTFDIAAETSPDHVIELGIAASPVLVDLDNDQKLEIVVAAMDGQVYVWREDGTVQSGFPVKLQDPLADKRGRIVSHPAVGDVDGDGTIDIVVGTNEALDSFGPLYVVHGDGTNHAGGAIHQRWPKRIISLPVLPFVGEGMPNAPALADVNGDGLPEIGIGGVGTAAFVYRNTAEQEIPICFGEENVDLSTPGWESKVVSCSEPVTKPCNEINDPKIKCVRGAMNNAEFGAKSAAMDTPSVSLITNPSFGDLDNNGFTDLVLPMGGFGAAESFAGGGKRSDFEHHVGGWNTLTRDYLPGFPVLMNDWQFFSNPTIADITGDGKPEVLAADAGYYVYAYDVDGNQPAGWPKLTGQWNIVSPTVGDVTGDGKLEVVVNTRQGYLYVWKTQGDADGRIDWPTFGHDNHNTRNLSSPLSQGIRSPNTLPSGLDAGVSAGDGSAPPKDDGCSLSPGASPPWMMLLLLALVWRRRGRTG